MLLRMYRSCEERPLEVVWIYLEEFGKLVTSINLLDTGFAEAISFLSKTR